MLRVCRTLRPLCSEYQTFIFDASPRWCDAQLKSEGKGVVEWIPGQPLSVKNLPGNVLIAQKDLKEALKFSHTELKVPVVIYLPSALGKDDAEKADGTPTPGFNPFSAIFQLPNLILNRKPLSEEQEIMRWCQVNKISPPVAALTHLELD